MPTVCSFPIKYIMLSRELIDYQRVIYSKVGFFPIMDIMLNRIPAGLTGCISTRYTIPALAPG